MDANRSRIQQAFSEADALADKLTRLKFTGNMSIDFFINQGGVAAAEMSCEWRKKISLRPGPVDEVDLFGPK